MPVGGVVGNTFPPGTKYTYETNEVKEVKEDMLASSTMESKKVPYSKLAKDGVINYNGVIFNCDYDNNRICLGNVSNSKDCLNIPLSGGGCLVVNRDNLGDLSKAIGMFSPEDVNNILRAIAKDKKARQVQNEIEEDTNGIGNGSTNAAVGGEEASSTNLSMDESSSVLKETVCIAQTEWERLSENYNSIQQQIKEVIPGEISQDLEEVKQKDESGTVSAGEIDTLLSESTVSASAESEGEEKNWYITVYSKEGIYCSKGSQGKIWSIPFKNSDQYEKVIEFLKQFDSKDNLRFAANEDFWKDFLDDNINVEEIKDNYSKKDES